MTTQKITDFTAKEREELYCKMLASGIDIVRLADAARKSLTPNDLDKFIECLGTAKPREFYLGRLMGENSERKVMEVYSEKPMLGVEDIIHVREILED